MPKNTFLKGKEAESLAVDFLKKNGYEVLFLNYRNIFGEIDIIAKDKDTYCFIEVKSRLAKECGLPKEAVEVNKQKRLGKIAVFFLKEKNLLKQKARFDVVSITGESKNKQIELIQNAFDLDDEFDY